MSSTLIYAFDREGNACKEIGIRNAWRGAMSAWNIMETRHLPPYYKQGIKLSRVICGETAADEVWALADNKEIPVHERIVMLTTMDKCLVKKENLPKVIEAFRKFDGITSLPEQADILEKLLADDNCIAVGWNQTSVSSSFWFKHNDDTGKIIPYNCLTMNDHFWLFDDLNEEETK